MTHDIPTGSGGSEKHATGVALSSRIHFSFASFRHTLLRVESPASQFAVAFEAARPLLPWWVPWLSVGVVLSLAVAVGLLSWMGASIARIPLSRYRGEPGLERNRHAFVAVRGALLSAVVVVTVAVVMPIAFSSNLSVVNAGALGPLSGGAAFIIAGRIWYRALRRARERPPTVRELFVSLVILLILFLPGLVIVCIAGFFVPPEPGLQMAIVLSVAIVLVLATTGDATLHILRSLRLLEPAPERLQVIAQRVGTALELVPRNVWILHWYRAQAIAFPSQTSIAFTDAALDCLDDEEVASICAHEMAHLKEPKWLLRCRELGALWMTPLLFVAPMIDRAGLFFGVLVPVFAALFWFFLSQSLLRRTEARADEVAAKYNSDNTIHHRALARLYEANGLPARIPGVVSHPHLDVRTKASARAASPPMWAAWLGVAVSFVIALMLFLVVRVGLHVGSDESLWRAAAVGRDGQLLAMLARERFDENKEESLVLYEAATAIRPERADYAIATSSVLTHLGQCERARTVLQRVEDLETGPWVRELEQTRVSLEQCVPTTTRAP